MSTTMSHYQEKLNKALNTPGTLHDLMTVSILNQGKFVEKDIGSMAKCVQMNLSILNMANDSFLNFKTVLPFDNFL